MAELPSIAEFVDELKNRIALYSREFSRDRELVRSSIVEPFLRLMGWDPENPSEVRPYYQAFNRKVDYALFSNGDLVAFVVVGMMGTSIAEPRIWLQFCSASNVDYFLATDGNVWQVHRKDGVKIMEWNILEEPVEKLLEKIDAFRRLLGLESGRYEEEIRCYTKGGREIRINVLESTEGLIVKGMKQAGKLPYAHIATMLREGKVVFLSGGIDNKNVTYIRKRIENEVGCEVECFQALYGNKLGYSFVLKTPRVFAENSQ